MDLYTQRIRESPAFMLGKSLGPGEGDNFAVYYTDNDRDVKQRIVEAVTSHIPIGEEDLEQILVERRSGLGRGLASLIPPIDEEKGEDDGDPKT